MVVIRLWLVAIRLVAKVLGINQTSHQSNYKAFRWGFPLEAMQDPESLEGHGWTKDEELLVSLPIRKASAPVSLNML